MLGFSLSLSVVVIIIAPLVILSIFLFSLLPIFLFSLLPKPQQSLWAELSRAFCSRNREIEPTQRWFGIYRTCTELTSRGHPVTGRQEGAKMNIKKRTQNYRRTGKDSCRITGRQVCAGKGHTNMDGYKRHSQRPINKVTHEVTRIPSTDTQIQRTYADRDGLR